jgi:hypothetical protein
MASKQGLWDNIRKKRERIKAGSGEKMRKPGTKGAPTKQALIDSQTNKKPKKRKKPKKATG